MTGDLLMSEKKKFFRLLPLLGGLITIVISFIAEIPLGGSISLSFHIMESEGVYMFIWGMVEDGEIWSNFSSFSIDNIIPLILWIALLFSGISGLISASYKENPRTIKKLLLIAGITILIEFAYFTVIFFLNFGTSTLGLGFYCMIVVLLLYFLSAGLVTGYQKI